MDYNRPRCSDLQELGRTTSAPAPIAQPKGAVTMAARTRIRVAPDFTHQIARVGLSQREFARRSGLALSTLKGPINPARITPLR